MLTLHNDDNLTTLRQFVAAGRRSDLDATEADVDASLAQLATADAEAHEAWITHQAQLDDVTAERWTTLVQTRQQAQSRYDRLNRGKYPSSLGVDEIAQQIAAAKATLDEVTAKVARTRAKGGPLAELLTIEALFQDACKRVADERTRLAAAKEEIAVTRGEIEAI